MARNLYHSELTKMGQVQVTVKSDVLNSKYPNKPPYIVIELNGEDRNYTAENDVCANALRGRNGQTIVVQASGQRNNASLVVVGSGQQQAQPPARTAPIQRQAPIARQNYNSAPLPPAAPAMRTMSPEELFVAIEKRAKLYFICLTTARGYRERWDALHPEATMTEDQFQAMASSLFISAERGNLVQFVPEDEIENYVMPPQ